MDRTEAARRLRDWRHYRSLTMAATEIGSDATALGRIERGERRPGLELACRIHHVVGIPPEAWTTEPDEPGDCTAESDAR